MNFKRLIILHLLLILPFVSFAQGQENAIDLFIKLILFCQFSLTALSFILCIIFYKKQQGNTRTIAIIISIIMTFIASIYILTATWDLESGDMYEKDMAFEQLKIGYWLLVPNLIVVFIAPFLKLIKNKITEVHLKG